MNDRLGTTLIVCALLIGTSGLWYCNVVMFDRHHFDVAIPFLLVTLACTTICLAFLVNIYRILIRDRL